jgi:hypothetical protein
VSVGNPEVSQMPGEVGAEFGAVVSLNALNRDRQAATQFVDKGRRGADRVVGIDLQDPVARRFVDGRELVEPATSQTQVLDIDLDRVASGMEVPTPPGAGR